MKNDKARRISFLTTFLFQIRGDFNIWPVPKFVEHMYSEELFNRTEILEIMRLLFVSRGALEEYIKRLLEETKNEK